MSENAIAELQAIEGEDDFFSLGEVPPDWCANRMMGTASAEGNDAEICGGEWIAYLRRGLASECLRLGITDLDAIIVSSRSSASLP